MRARGRLGLALVVLLLAVGGGVALEQVGPRTRPAASAGGAPSGAWFCPHGGGRAWQTDLYLANPGTTPVDVRVSSIGDHKPGAATTATVQPGAELVVPAVASDTADASYVEYFGGWVAAGWVARAGGGESGVAAEPCSPEAGTRWLAPDGTTEQGQHATLIVMNPFDVVAVVDVTVYTATRAPIRNSDLTDQEVPPHHSIALELNAVALDEPAAGAEVRASAGRVAVASLGIGDAGGIRSALAVPAPGTSRSLSSTGDAGQSTLAVMATGEGQVRFGAILLSGRRPQPAGGLSDASQAGRSAHAYPLITDEPSAVLVTAPPGAPPLAVARRVQGRGADAGSTTGVASPAEGWIVLPTVGGDPNTPGLVLTNPGSDAVEVTLALLTQDGRDPATQQLTVPATSAIDVPASFLATDPRAAVLVEASGAVTATGASSSGGKLGVAGFAVAAGVPIPASEGPIP